jgi:hypothetical protein
MATIGRSDITIFGDSANDAEQLGLLAKAFLEQFGCTVHVREERHPAELVF